MSRLLPNWVGSVAVPDNRETTKQMLFCWAQILDEIANVKPLLRKLDEKMTEQSFVLQAQEVSMYLSGMLDEKKFPMKNKTSIWVGNPTTATGVFNARVAQVMHQFFDEADYQPSKKHPCVECNG